MTAVAHDTAVDRDARALLESRGIPVTDIVSVCPEAILYLRDDAAAMTAWLAVRGDRTEVACERGFPAEPAGWVVRKLDLNTMPIPDIAPDDHAP